MFVAGSCWGGYGGRNSWWEYFAYSSLCRIIPYARLGHDYLSSARYSALLTKIRLHQQKMRRVGLGRWKLGPSGELRWKPPFKCWKWGASKNRAIGARTSSLSLFNIPSFYRCIGRLVLFFSKKAWPSSWEIPKAFFQSTTRPDSWCVILSLSPFLYTLQAQWSRSQAADLYSPKRITGFVTNAVVCWIKRSGFSNILWRTGGYLIFHHRGFLLHV